jgi:hypothetical protein
LTALKSVRVVDIDLGDGTTKRSVTAGTHRAAMVLRAHVVTNPNSDPRKINGLCVKKGNMGFCRRPAKFAD